MTAILTRPATYSATTATARRSSIKNLLTTAKTTPVVLSAVRVIVSFLWICHGLQGLIGVFGGIDGHGTAVPPSMVEGYSASLIETVVGALVLLGLATRICAVLCSGVMAFAYFTVHIHLGLFPIENQGEEAVLYCWIFLLIAFAGPGKFALDALIRRRRTSR
ncbi:MAG TPA: DoxX family protein [Pseudonocardiaceae bacterium]|nr:DoxX family protein [Pseudonocardiaceae bacterium]